VLVACGSSQPVVPDAGPGTVDAAVDAPEQLPDASDIVDAPEPPGTPSWTRQFGGSAADSLSAVALASDGGIVLAGLSNGMVDLGGGAIGGVGEQRAIIIAKLTATGEHVWSRALPIASSFSESAPAVAIAVNLADDTIYLATGATAASVDVGTGALPRLGGIDLLLVKLASDGTVSAARRLGGTLANTGARDLALDTAGNLYVAGGVAPLHGGGGSSATIDLGTGAITGTGTHDAWIASFDPALASRWSRKLGSPTFPIGISADAIAIDPAAQRVVVCGSFNGTVDLGGGARTAAGTHRDIYLATLARSDGGYVADAILGGTGDEDCADLAIAGTSRVVAGSFAGTLTIGGVSRTAIGFHDAFVAKLDGDSATFVTSFGAFQKSAGVNAITGSGLAGGGFGGTIDLAGTPLTAAMFGSGFAAQLDPAGAAAWAARLVDQGGGRVLAVADAPGGAVVVGSYEGALLIDGVQVSSHGFTDMFVARLAP